MNGIEGYRSYVSAYGNMAARTIAEQGREGKGINAPEKEDTPSAARAKDAYGQGGAVKKSRSAGAAKEVKLSGRAQKLLDELKKKYSNMDFNVAHYETDEEAQSYMRGTSKEYSVLLDPDTLEEMAGDKAVREKYEGVLDGAGTKLEEAKEQLGEDAEKVKVFGISVGRDGSVSFFAELEKSADAQKERIEEAREKKKQQAETHGKSVTVKADTIEELIEKIRNTDLTEKRQEESGTNFDIAI